MYMLQISQKLTFDKITWPSLEYEMSWSLFQRLQYYSSAFKQFQSLEYDQNTSPKLGLKSVTWWEENHSYEFGYELRSRGGCSNQYVP